MGDPRFVGAWDLEHTEVRDAQGKISGEMLPRWSGQIMYTADGRMSAHLIAPEGTVKPAAPAAQPGQDRLSPEKYTGYYGTYTIDDGAGIVTHHMMAATAPSLLVSDQRRWFTFDGDQLILRPNTAADGTVRSLFWRRVKQD